MGASLSNPHFLAFADHYNDAQDAGRAPMNWRQFLDTRALGPGDDEAELRSWDMDMHVEQMAAQRRAARARDSIADPNHPIVRGAHDLLQNPGDPDAMARFAAEIMRGPPSQRRLVGLPVAAPRQAPARRATAPARPARSPPRSSSGTVASLEARLASKEADIDVLKAQVQSLNMALEESRQQASTGVAASLEALEPRSLSASELAALRAALPRAVSAVETEVSRRLVAAEATRSDAQDVREDEALCVCCLDRPRDIVFLSCMHVVVCEQCAPRTASCPTCRVPITEKRRIFR